MAKTFQQLTRPIQAIVTLKGSENLAFHIFLKMQDRNMHIHK